MKLISLLIIQLFLINSLFSQVNANYNNDVVGISWANPLKLEIDYFVIEKSKNGNKFKELMKIEGSKKLDNSISYFEIDQNPFDDKGFYRIKQVDIEGNIYYSNIIFTKNMKNVKPIFDLFTPLQNSKELRDYNGDDILLVLINSKQKEFVIRATVIEENNKLIITSFSNWLPTGNYLVTSTSEDKLYGKNIDVNGSYINFASTLSTK